MDTETKPLWTTTREAVGKTWTLRLCADDTALNKDGSKIGKAHYTRQEICINANMPMQGRDETLLHELLHCSVLLTGSELSERDVESLSSVLYAYLRGFGLWQPVPWPDKDD